MREDGRVTGQTRVQETAAGQAVDFALGRDPDVSYVRSVKALSRTARSAVFQVTYALENSKKQPVKVEITESLYNDRAEVKAEGALGAGVRREGGPGPGSYDQGPDPEGSRSVVISSGAYRGTAGGGNHRASAPSGSG